MGWVPDEVVEAMRGSHLLGIFVRLDIDPPLRLWLGVNDVPSRIVSVDPGTNQTYLGGGRLRDVPNLEVPINGTAERVEFQITGIDPATAAQIDIDEPRGKVVHVGITVLDEYYQPISTIIPLARGVASHVSEKSDAVQGASNVTVTESLSVGFGATTRGRNAASMWSQAHQRALYQTDDFCKNTARQARGVNVTWPRF